VTCNCMFYRFIATFSICLTAASTTGLDSAIREAVDHYSVIVPSSFWAPQRGGRLRNIHDKFQELHSLAPEVNQEVAADRK
jgi:hypothetical protein